MKWATHIFCFPSAYRICLYCPVVYYMCNGIILEQQITYFKNVSLIKTANCHLILKWVIIFLLVEGLKYWRNYQNVTQSHEMNKCCCKNCADKTWLMQNCHTTSICKKIQYLQNTVKQSIITWSILVYPAVEFLGHMVVLYLTFWDTPGTILT